MGTILGTLLAFAIVFGILVFIHEFGHFFMAKLVGIRVEVFSFGYGKRLLGIKRGTTDYRVSVFPLGGYVKFLGEGVFEPGRELAVDDFMAQKRWERFLVMVMGSVMNILLAVFLFSVINMAGVTVPEYQDQKPVIGWIESGSPAEKSLLQIDDEILRINGREVKTWADVELAVESKPERLITLDIKREGKIFPIQLMTETEKMMKYEMGYAGFRAKILTQVAMVKPDSPAEKGGLKAGDIILAINGQPIYFYKFVETIGKNPDKELEFSVEREGKPLTLRITPRKEGKVGKIGISPVAKSVVKKFGFSRAINQSVKENIKMVFLIINYLKELFKGEASTRQMGGPLEIASLSFAFFQMGFMAMMSWIAILSLQLGVINLFPIPVFDGGQIFVLLLEGIFRRDFTPKVRQIWMQIGFVIFIFLLGFLILNDIVKRMPNGWRSLVPF